MLRVRPLNRDATLDELRRLAEADKSVVGVPEWIADDEGASPLRRLTSPLCIDGVIVSGLILRLDGPRATPPDRPFYDLRARLTASIDGQLFHLGRLEFDPPGEGPHHRNPLGARFAPPVVTGPHHHSFAENAALGLVSFAPASNLPVALPEGREFKRFDDVLEVVRSRFVMPGFWTEDPEWLRLLA